MRRICFLGLDCSTLDLRVNLFGMLNVFVCQRRYLIIHHQLHDSLIRMYGDIVSNKTGWRCRTTRFSKRQWVYREVEIFVVLTVMRTKKVKYSQEYFTKDNIYPGAPRNKISGYPLVTKHVVCGSRILNLRHIELNEPGTCNVIRAVSRIFPSFR